MVVTLPAVTVLQWRLLNEAALQHSCGFGRNRSAQLPSQPAAAMTEIPAVCELFLKRS